MKYLILFIFIFLTNAFSKVDFIDCHQALECGVLTDIQVNESATPKILKKIIDSALRAPNVRKQIVKPYDDIEIRNNPSEEKCQEYNVPKDQCQDICKRPEILKKQKEGNWSLCPVSVPGVLAGKSILKIASQVPVDINLENFELKDFQIGGAEIKKRGKKDFTICLPIKKLQVQSDVVINESSNPSKQVMGLRKLNLKLDQEKSQLPFRSKICFKALTSNGKVDKFIRLENFDKKESEESQRAYLLRSLDINKLSDKDLRQLQSHLENIYPELVGISNLDDLKKAFVQIQNNHKDELMTHIPRGVLSLSVLYSDKDIENINKIAHQQQYLRVKTRINNFPAKYDPVKFDTYLEDLPEELKLNILKKTTAYRNGNSAFMNKLKSFELSHKILAHITFNKNLNNKEKIALIKKNFPSVKKDHLKAFNQLFEYSDNQNPLYSLENSELANLVQKYLSKEEQGAAKKSALLFMHQFKDELYPELYREFTKHNSQLGADLLLKNPSFEEVQKLSSKYPNDFGLEEIFDNTLTIISSHPEYKRFDGENEASLFLASSELINKAVLQHPYILSKIESILGDSLGPVLTDLTNDLMDNLNANNYFAQQSNIRINEPLASTQDSINYKIINSYKEKLIEDFKLISKDLDNIKNPQDASQFDINNYNILNTIDRLRESIPPNSLSQEYRQFLELAKDYATKLRDQIEKTKEQFGNEFNENQVTQKRKKRHKSIILTEKSIPINNLLSDDISLIEAKITSIDQSILDRESQMDLIGIAKITDHFSDGFNVVVAMPELCDKKVGMQTNKNSTPLEHDLGMHVNIDSLNEMLKHKSENKDFDICLDISGRRTCSTEFGFANKISCSFKEAPYIEWKKKDNKHKIIFPKINCSTQLFGSTYVVPRLLNEDLSFELDFEPAVCHGGKICLEPDVKAKNVPIRIDGLFSFLTSFIKTATVIYPVVLNTTLGPILDGNASSALREGIDSPGFKIIATKKNPQTLSFFLDLDEDDPTIDDYLTEKIDSSMQD